MEDSKIMIAIVLILFFVMMNKKSCSCMEKFGDNPKCINVTPPCKRESCNNYYSEKELSNIENKDEYQQSLLDLIKLREEVNDSTCDYSP